jgi:hypothetical protein
MARADLSGVGVQDVLTLELEPLGSVGCVKRLLSLRKRPRLTSGLLIGRDLVRTIGDLCFTSLMAYQVVEVTVFACGGFAFI